MIDGERVAVVGGVVAAQQGQAGRGVGRVGAADHDRAASRQQVTGVADGAGRVGQLVQDGVEHDDVEGAGVEEAVQAGRAQVGDDEVLQQPTIRLVDPVGAVEPGDHAADVDQRTGHLAGAAADVEHRVVGADQRDHLGLAVVGVRGVHDPVARRVVRPHQPMSLAPGSACRPCRIVSTLREFRREPTFAQRRSSQVRVTVHPTGLILSTAGSWG